MCVWYFLWSIQHRLLNWKAGKSILVQTRDFPKLQRCPFWCQPCFSVSTLYLGPVGVSAVFCLIVCTKVYKRLFQQSSVPDPARSCFQSASRCLCTALSTQMVEALPDRPVRGFFTSLFPWDKFHQDNLYSKFYIHHRDQYSAKCKNTSGKGGVREECPCSSSHFCMICPAFITSHRLVSLLRQ